MASWCKKGGYNAQISPKSELRGFKWQTPTTNVSMTLCNWQMCHQTPVLCGRTAFEPNQIRHQRHQKLGQGHSFYRGGGGTFTAMGTHVAPVRPSQRCLLGPFTRCWARQLLCTCSSGQRPRPRTRPFRRGNRMRGGGGAGREGHGGLTRNRYVMRLCSPPLCCQTVCCRAILVKKGAALGSRRISSRSCGMSEREGAGHGAPPAQNREWEGGGGGSTYVKEGFLKRAGPRRLARHLPTRDL